MKPIIQSIIEDSPSIYSTTLKAKEVEKEVSELFALKKHKAISDSDMPIYITLLFNSKKQEMLNLLGSNRLAVKNSQELESDHDIYLLHISLLQVRIPNEFKSCVILISTSEYHPKGNDGNEKKDDLPTFTAVEANRTFENIILPQEVKDRLFRAISIIEHKDIIFDVLEFKKVDPATKTIICFYGPAGTGKTITAQAIAHYLGKRIMISSYAQIESKYVGDGAKNLRNIFKAAEEQDAVLFMDEADSFLSKRIESTSNGSDKHYNRMSNEMFQLLENFNGCVIFATNLHSDVDKAFKSRIVDSIYFPLPDSKCRALMLKTMVPKFIIDKVFNPESDELEKFCESLDGFSGRDIRKSLLLTYANIAPEIKKKGLENVLWSQDNFSIGFKSVRETVETTDEIPLDDVNSFLETKKFKTKQFELAKQAVLVDGQNIDEREKELINDLSLSLKGVTAQDEDVKCVMTLEEICKDVDESQKKILIDTAVRVVTIDGDFSKDEQSFMLKLCSLLGLSQDYTAAIMAYAESMAKSYLLWINSLELS